MELVALSAVRTMAGASLNPSTRAVSMMAQNPSPRLRVIVNPSFRSMGEVFRPSDRERLYEVCDVVWGRDDVMPLDQFQAELPSANAVVFGTFPGNPDEFHRDLPLLRAVFDASGGVPAHLDLAAAFRNGVYVGGVAPAFARQVAEMGLALTLASTREVCVGDRAMRAGEERWLHAGNEATWLLFGKTVGFVGCGSIARVLQRLLAPFGVRVLGFDPWIPDRMLRRDGIEPVGLEELFDASDVVYALAVPTPANAGMISRLLMERLRPHCLLVVLSRAHVVDFAAMSELALANRFRVALDVYDVEPFDPQRTHPLRQAPNVVHSAHRAGAVAEGLWEIGEMILDDLELLSLGMAPRSTQRITPEMWNRIRGQA